MQDIPENDSYWDQVSMISPANYFASNTHFNSILSCLIHLPMCSPSSLLITVCQSPPGILTKLTQSSVRRALLDAPENVATLIRVVTSRLFNLIIDHTFPSSTGDPVSAFASSFMKAGSNSTDRNTTKEVLNCLRILQRVFPVIFEVEGESNAFELEVLWKKPEFEGAGDTAVPQFVIDDDDSEGEGGAPERAASTQPKRKELPSLGDKLFNAITDLLFCCGFTLPKKIQVDHYKINYVIWCVVYKTRFHSAQIFQGRRVSVLRQIQAPVTFMIITKPRFSAFFLFSYPGKYTSPRDRCSRNHHSTAFISSRRLLVATS